MGLDYFCQSMALPAPKNPFQSAHKWVFNRQAGCTTHSGAIKSDKMIFYYLANISLSLHFLSALPGAST